MTARSLLVGLDGADLDVVRAIGPSRLPRLFEIGARGTMGRLRSVRPEATLPNWTSILTGVNPGRHGVFDFTLRAGKRVRFTAGTVREAPTVAARLDRLGLECACIGFPATWPPEELAHGIFVSGWDAPVAFEADRSFVWPRALHDELRARFGPWRFDDVDEFHADGTGWHAALADKLCRRIGKRTEVLLWLLERRAWDLFACYFGESDTAAHHLWSLHDPSSPRRPATVSDAEASGLVRVYEALDVSVGRLLRAAGGERVEVTIVSDHGSGGSSDKVLYLNRALAEAGLLTLREGTAMARATGGLKTAALRVLPARVRERAFRAFGRALPGWLESRARFAGIDFSRTLAFSDELNYYPAVWLNLREREPEGIVEGADRERVEARVREALRSLRDPWTGEPVVRSVHPARELYDGPYTERAADLWIELELDHGASYAVLPTSSAPPGTGPFRRLAPDEYLGRKGRSMPGSHRPLGLFAAAGPDVETRSELELGVVDATAVILARLGMAAEDLEGRVPMGMLRSRETNSLPSVGRRAGATLGDLARVEERLRALGYVD